MTSTAVVHTANIVYACLMLCSLVRVFPGFQRLQVEVVAGKLRVRAKKDDLAKTKRPNTILTVSSRAQKNVSVLIIGGGRFI